MQKNVSYFLIYPPLEDMVVFIKVFANFALPPLLPTGEQKYLQHGPYITWYMEILTK